MLDIRSFLCLAGDMSSFLNQYAAQLPLFDPRHLPRQSRLSGPPPSPLFDTRPFQRDDIGRLLSRRP